jgi:dihydroflavonol-4-reductase
MSRVFLTGATGFIGGALLERLVRRGDAVVALARSDAAAATLAARGAAVARGDVLDEDALADGMAGCELAFHVAGINTLCPDDPARLLQVNVRGNETAVRAAARAGIGRLVLTSSAATLGEARGEVGSETSPHRGWFLSTYERSKHDGELAARAAARRAGLDLVTVNPSSVQGPGRTHGTGRILIGYLNGRLRVFLDTDVSLLDIDDCVEGHLLAADRGRGGERYVLCGGALRARQALELVSELTGVRHRVATLPGPVAMGAAAAVEAIFRARGRHPPLCREMVRTLLHGHRYDGSRAARELGLAYTPVRDTLARTVAWALEQGLITAPLPGWHGPHRPNPDRVDSSQATDGERPMDDERIRATEQGEPELHDERIGTTEQGESDFARGERTQPEPEVAPDFARGARTEPQDAEHDRGRFSTGIEQEPEEPEERGRFSTGIEQEPHERPKQG